MKKCFKTLYRDLVHKGHRQNVLELLDMLKVLSEPDEITRAEYSRWADKINGYPEGGYSKIIKLDSSSEASDESETVFNMGDSIPKNVGHHRVYTDDSLTTSEQK